MRNIEYPRTHFWTATWVGVLTCVVLSLSCQETVDDAASSEASVADETTSAAIEDGANDGEVSPLKEERCEEPITAEIAPSESVSDETGVYRYDYSLQDSEISVGLMDGDGALLGRVEVDADADFDFRAGALRQWQVTTRYVDAAGDDEDATPVEQVLRAREVGQGRLWFEVSDRVGDDELIQWAVMGGEPEPLMQMLAVEVDEEPDSALEDRVQTNDGRVFETLQLLDGDGERIGEDLVDAWLDEHIGDALTSHQGWQRMTAAADDLALLRGADAHIKLCRAAGINIAEEDLIERSQGLCPAMETDADTEEDQWRQMLQDNCYADALVESERWLSVGLEINDIYGALGFGVTITAAAVGAGLVGATGGGALLVFAGSVAAYVVVTNMVENFVSNNSESIMDGLFTAAGAATDDPDAADEAADFMTGRHAARSGGDPHFDTFDGLAFDFHGAGEFVLVEATGGEPFQIQARQEPMAGNCPGVAINTGMATKIGDTRIAVYAGEEARFLIDGGPADLPGGIQTFPGGGSVEEVDEDTFQLYWPTGEGLHITPRWSNASGAYLLDLVVALPDNRAGQVQGLLGDYNGDPATDIRPRGGEPFEAPVQWEDLTFDFGHSWRIDPEESLFDYESGESNSSFTNESFPAQPTRLEDLPEDSREHAEGVCSDAGIENEAAFRGCVIDVVCTGSDSLADSHVDRDPEFSLEVTHDDSEEPEEPEDPPEFADDYPSISVGNFDRWCLLKGVGDMECWNGDEPLDYPFADDATVVSIGVGHEYCGLDGSGGLHCWQLSFGEISEHTNPLPGSFEHLKMGPDDYGCALNSAGNPHCWWGSNTNSYPIADGTPPGDAELTSMALGLRHMCGLLDDGSLQCWGDNDHGQATPPGGDDFVEVASSMTTSCALKDDGSVECWGNINTSASFDESLGDTDDVGPFETIDMGAGSACGLKADGTIECWHDPGGGHRDPPSGSFVDLSLSQSRACAVDEDANVECW